MLTGLRAGCSHNHSKIVSATSTAAAKHTCLAKIGLILSWICAVQDDASARVKDDLCVLIDHLGTKRPINSKSDSESTTLGTLGNNYQ